MKFYRSDNKCSFRIISKLLILFLFFLIPTFSHSIAQSAPLLTLEDDSERYPLGPLLDILEDIEGKLTIDDVRSHKLNEEWVINKKRIPNFGFSSSACHLIYCDFGIKKVECILNKQLLLNKTEVEGNVAPIYISLPCSNLSKNREG